MYGENGRIFREVLYRILDRAGFPRVKRHGKLLRIITFHDLRHTFASHWMMNGGDIFKLQKILGHKSVNMTMRYSHLAPDAFISDYGRLNSIDAISPPSSVISLGDRTSAENADNSAELAIKFPS